jgi:hypothetical protein
MDLLGTIEPTAATSAGRNEWLTLVGTHPSLAPVPPRQGINPFTKEPMQYKAAPDTARVLVEGSEVGYFAWAEDDSQVLAVWSDAGAEKQVSAVASDVAARLGWQFVPSGVV